MSSSATSSPANSKVPPPSSTSNYSQTPSNSADPSSKRTNSSSNSGAGASTRHSSQPRNNQPLRKQHKAQRRAKLVDDDALAETAAMRSINSRRGQTSITHLMNFSLPPRPTYQNQNHHVHSRYPRRNPTWGLGSGYHAVDKARYVHANYRFIVRPDKEYHTQAVDADVHLPWDSVLQILVSAETQTTNCPICLSTPVAPRMAKCGHIFCLPCLIRYMHSTDDTHPVPEKRARWKKCPICEDSIYISETRPVRWFVGQEASMLQEGGDVLLRLLMREPGMTLALPRDAAENYGHHDDIPWLHVAEMMDYARFMKGGEDYMHEQFDREMNELETQEKEDELMFGDDITWTRKAIATIEDAKQKLSGLGNPPLDGKTNMAKKVDEPETRVQNSWSSGPNNLAASPNTNFAIGSRSLDSWEDENESANTSVSQSSGIANAVQQLSISSSEVHRLGNSKHSASLGRPPPHSFYFYHALPNFFLSPLDIRILKSAFGEFSAFPSTILPRIEHISTGHIIDDDLRKRAKYMAHLPYGCEVTFLECDWTDVISPAILEQFHEEIMRRRKRNHEKEAREERDRIRAEKEEEDKRWASARRRRPSAVGKSFSETDFQPLGRSDQQTGSFMSEAALATTPPWGNARTQSSFATLASPGTSPDAPRTVWGTAAIAATSPPLLATQDDLPHQDDGWLQGWEKDLLDEGDAVAMVEATMHASGSSSSKQGPGAGAAKKAKKKKITLMSTNNRRGA